GLGEVLEDPAGDRVPRGSRGQRRAREPARVRQLLPLDRDLAARVRGDGPDHELAREGAGLAHAGLAGVHAHGALFLALARRGGPSPPTAGAASPGRRARGGRPAAAWPASGRASLACSPRESAPPSAVPRSSTAPPPTSRPGAPGRAPRRSPSAPRPRAG